MGLACDGAPDFLNNAFPQIPEKYMIRIYVDTLDECGDENARKMVKYFNRLAFKLSFETTLRMCFSCRHYPLVALEHGLTICVEDENSGDILRYVQDEFKRGPSNNAKVQDLEKVIVTESSGVF